jgi:sulfite oxidase
MSHPPKHPDFIVRQSEPLVGGPPLELLVAQYVTPEPLFYVRDHARAVPEVDAASYRLVVGGMVRRPADEGLGLADDEVGMFGRVRHRTAVAGCQ